MRSPRSVTAVPMGFPCRTLKPAMERRARVMIGFCPDIVVRSRTALSIARPLVNASPKPMFRLILVYARAPASGWSIQTPTPWAGTDFLPESDLEGLEGGSSVGSAPLLPLSASSCRRR